MEKYVIILGNETTYGVRPVFKAKVMLGELKIKDKAKIYNVTSYEYGEGVVLRMAIDKKNVNKVSQGDKFLLMIDFFRDLERTPYGQCTTQFSGNYIMVSDRKMLHNYFTLELEDNEDSRNLLQNKRVNTIFSDVADIFNFTFTSELSKQTEYPNNKLRVNVEMIYRYYFQEGDTVTLVHKETKQKVSGKIVKVIQ